MEQTDQPTVFIVHAVDTEGPLDENLEATFQRVHEIYGYELPWNNENLRLIQAGDGVSLGMSSADAESAAITFSQANLSYNRSWDEIEQMNRQVFDRQFREAVLDSAGQPWKISWFCMDHGDLASNPRNKQLGFGEVHDYYRKLINRSDSGDEIQFHFHPRAVNNNPLSAATSYNNNSHSFVQELARRLLKFEWFPSSYRPGFHSIRPDSNLFLEQWFPFDYSNQSYPSNTGQPDLDDGRFGDWSRASKSWSGYRPAVHDYQSPGELHRTVFRCLNVGTRHRLLTRANVVEAFREAKERGFSVLAFTNHDWRDIRPDISWVRSTVASVSQEFKDVKFLYSGAEQAGIATVGDASKRPNLILRVSEGRALVELVGGEIHGAQPFFGFQTAVGDVFHDNLDVVEPGRAWGYRFDSATYALEEIVKVGVGAASVGGTSAKVVTWSPDSSAFLPQ